MNKNSFDHGMTPWQTFLLSTAAGSGAFGASRLYQEAKNTVNPPAPQKRDLVINLPAQAKSASDGAYAGALAVGLPLGFLGTKAIYDGQKKKQLSDELDATKKKYQTALVAAKQASTPFVDGFCAALAEHADKLAGFGDFVSGSMSGENNPHSMAGSAIDLIPGHTAAGNAMLAMMAAGGAGTLGAMIMADKNKQRAMQKRQFPENVVLNEIPVSPTPNTTSNPSGY